MTSEDHDMVRGDLDALLNEHFAGKIVRKDLTKLVKEGANVPVFVLEYLLGNYCSSQDEEIVAEGLQTVKRILAENFVRPDEAEKVKSLVRECSARTRSDLSSRFEPVGETLHPQPDKRLPFGNASIRIPAVQGAVTAQHLERFLPVQHHPLAAARRDGLVEPIRRELVLPLDSRQDVYGILNRQHSLGDGRQFLFGDIPTGSRADHFCVRPEPVPSRAVREEVLLQPILHQT